MKVGTIGGLPECEYGLDLVNWLTRTLPAKHDGAFLRMAVAPWFVLQTQTEIGSRVAYPVFDVVPHSLFEPTSYRTGVRWCLELFLRKSPPMILEILQ